jgi:hypothetical protein
MKGDPMRIQSWRWSRFSQSAPMVRAQNLHVNDGSSDPPKLWIAINVWGLEGLPAGHTSGRSRRSSGGSRRREGSTWSIDIPPPIPGSEGAVAEIVGLAKKHGFRVGMATSIDRLEQLDVAIPGEKAGTPYVDVMTGPYTMPEDDAIRLIRAISDRFRAREDRPGPPDPPRLVTQDLLRTVEYTKAVPELRFDLDLSHYFVAGEIGGDLTAEALRAFDTIMARAVMLDGRVSNGEQVQIDIGPTGDNAHARRFAAL